MPVFTRAGRDKRKNKDNEIELLRQAWQRILLIESEIDYADTIEDDIMLLVSIKDHTANLKKIMISLADIIKKRKPWLDNKEQA